MPMYEYECAACGHRFERIQKFSDPPIEECPNCGEHKVQKLLSSPAIQFKGTGWYITDYAKKSGTGTDAKSDGSTDAGKESKDERVEGVIGVERVFERVASSPESRKSPKSRRAPPPPRARRAPPKRPASKLLSRSECAAPLDVFRAQICAERLAEIGASQREIDHRLQIAKLVAGVVTRALRSRTRRFSAAAAACGGRWSAESRRSRRFAVSRSAGKMSGVRR